MLEHAEISIHEAESLAQSTSLNTDNLQTANIRKVIGILRDYWSAESLPNDVRRLASNIVNVLNAAKVRPKRLRSILEDEKEKRGGDLPVNLSPYAAIIQALFVHERDKMLAMLSDANGRTKIIVPSEVDFPDDFTRSDCCNVVFVGV